MDLRQLALDLINNSCPNFVYDEKGERIHEEFQHEIELHCMTATVQVKVKSRDAEGLPDNYEILSIGWRDS